MSNRGKLQEITTGVCGEGVCNVGGSILKVTSERECAGTVKLEIGSFL